MQWSHNMKIGIFGGRFDPIHIGHVRAAIEFYEQLGLDKLIILPAGKANHKKVVASIKDRFTMVKLAFSTLDFITIDDYEAAGKSCCTVDTLKHYKTKYSFDELFFLIGHDEFLNFQNWKEWQTCFKLAQFVVISRTVDFNDPFHKLQNFLKIKMNRLDISSSQIRMTINKGKMVDCLTPDIVKKYINEKRLYR